MLSYSGNARDFKQKLKEYEEKREKIPVILTEQNNKRPRTEITEVGRGEIKRKKNEGT